MKHIRPALSRHRIARLIAWTFAMLLWLASVLAGGALKPRHERQRAERVSMKFLVRRVQLLIVARASQFARHRPKQTPNLRQRGRSFTRAGMLRALIGSRLRKQFKCTNPLECVMLMICAMRDLDVHARRFAKRIRLGLTRVWAIKIPKPALVMPILVLAAPEANYADSS